MNYRGGRDLISRFELEGHTFETLALIEEGKALPWNAVYDYFCLRNEVPVGEEFIPEIERYEKEVTSRR